MQPIRSTLIITGLTLALLVSAAGAKPKPPGQAKKAPPAATMPYTVQWLDGFAPVAVNAHGVSLGYLADGRPGLRAPDGSLTPLVEEAASVTALNRGGDVVGVTQDGQPFLIDAAGHSWALAVPESTQFAIPTALNHKGMIVGNLWIEDRYCAGVWTSPDAVATCVHAGEFTAINRRGTGLGWTGTYREDTPHAPFDVTRFLWHKGRLSTDVDEDTSHEHRPVGLTDDGVILWSDGLLEFANGTLEVLPRHPDWWVAQAEAVNQDLHVLISAHTATQAVGALWTPAHGLENLTTLAAFGAPCDLYGPFALSDAGHITGFAVCDGTRQGFLLTPTPTKGKGPAIAQR